MRNVLSKETKQEIIKSYNEKLPSIEIIKKFNISKATYYRIIKNLKDKSIENSNNITLNDNNDIQNNSQNISDNTDNSDDENNEKENNDNENENNENNDNDNDNDNNENNDNEFNIETFKRQINNDINDIENDNNDNDNNNINQNNNIDINENKTFKKINLKPIPIDNINDNSVISRISKISKVSRVSFARKKNKFNNILNNNRSTIMDTIKNVSTGDDLDTIKLKRKIIIKIRLYLKECEEDLKTLYTNKSNFERSLYTQNIDQLNIILEDIRITLNINRNKPVFFNCVETGLRTMETICNYSNFDITGTTDELMNDPEFLYDLKLMSCEINMTDYINPKTTAFMKIMKKVYVKNNENKIKKQINNVINDPAKLEKIINLDKNKK